MKRTRSGAGRIRLGQLGEDRLLAPLLRKLPGGKAVIAGAGDDCALVKFSSAGRLLVLKTDCVVEGIHFLVRANPTDVGWKAMMRPLSDFAAASAIPQFALVTLLVSRETEQDWVTKLYRGLNRAAEKFKVSVVGGDTSRTTGPAAISVAVAGFAEKDRWKSRRGGKAGDDLFVTGKLGGAVKGKKHLRIMPRIVESRWLTENFSIHAMMDISDGLGADLPRLARASKVGFHLDVTRLPLTRGAAIRNAISDGEDYELLFAVSPRDRDRLEKSWPKQFPKLPLTRIGRLDRQSAIGNRQLPGGYVHFK